MSSLQKMNKQVRQCGTTLIELSAVIAVLLLLVGVLFIGITAWKNGASKAACIINLSVFKRRSADIKTCTGWLQVPLSL